MIISAITTTVNKAKPTGSITFDYKLKEKIVKRFDQVIAGARTNSDSSYALTLAQGFD